MSWPSFLCALCAPLRHARLRPAPMAPPARKTPRLGKREILFRPAMLRPPPNPPPAGKTRQWGGGQRSQAKGQKPRNIQNGVWTTISQSMGNEMMEGIMRVKTLIYPRISRLGRDSVAGSRYRQRSAAANLGWSEKRTGLCHPFRMVIFLLRLPGVSLRATPWLPSGIPPGCGNWARGKVWILIIRLDAAKRQT